MWYPALRPYNIIPQRANWRGDRNVVMKLFGPAQQRLKLPVRESWRNARL